MWLYRVLKLGVTNLRRHKLRSLLTMLGVTLGVASVIAMLAIGEGSKREALKQIRKLGAENVIVRSVQPRRRNHKKAEDATSGGTEPGQNFGLTLQDLDRLTETIPMIRWAVPVVSQRMSIRHRNRDVPNVRILGTTPDYPHVKNLVTGRGRFLTAADTNSTSRVAVLGAGIVQQVYRFDDPLVNSLSIESNLFQVVGILHNTGEVAAADAEGLVNDVYVPISTFRRRFGNLGRTRLSEITLTMSDEKLVAQAASVTRRILSKAHDKLGDIEVVVPLELLRQVEHEKRIWNLVLGSIGGISLLVGGIGIMNIMLTTVTERTREIGVRRALGARRFDISVQFLAETVVLSTTGGVLGIVLGVSVPIALAQVSEIEMALTIWSVALAFGISVGVGVIFGTYPALKAAEMDPIEALRHE